MLIQRHYIKEFFSLFLIIGFGLALLLSLIGVVEKIDDLMPHDPSILNVLSYAAYGFPRYFLYLMPMAALLCSLYTIGHAAKNRELVAIMAAGGRLKRILLPFVLSGLMLSILGFALSEFIVPASARLERALVERITQAKQPATLYQEGVLWLRADDGSVIRMDIYIEETDTYNGVSVFQLDAGNLRTILKAKEARYDQAKGIWVLNDVSELDTATGRITRHGTLGFPALQGPDALKGERRKPYEMDIFELKRYRERLERAGFRNLKLSVEYHAKLSYPLISFFMVVLGVSFACRRSMGGLMATAIGLAISLTYWFGYTFFLSLGYAGILPPAVAVWIMPVIFGGLSYYLFMSIPE